MTHSFVIVERLPDDSILPIAVIDSNDCSIAVLGQYLPGSKRFCSRWDWLPSFYDAQQRTFNPWKEIVNEEPT